jgi:hypothetical protein
MSIRRVCSLLCTLICASLLMLSLGSQPGTAQNKNRELLPVVDGPIFDQSPFDVLEMVSTKIFRIPLF